MMLRIRTSSSKCDLARIVRVAKSNEFYRSVRQVIPAWVKVQRNDTNVPLSQLYTCCRIYPVIRTREFEEEVVSHRNNDALIHAL